MQIDLSSLAKGYAIDLIAEGLDTRKLDSYLIEIGGELSARGTNANDKPWRIGLEQPDSRSINTVRAAIDLRNCAVATSGSYRNYIESSQTSYSHIIDPRMGRPITHGLVSVSVIESTAMRADAWATALMVLGPDAGFDVATNQQIAAIFVIDLENRMIERQTKQFKQYVNSSQDRPK